MLFPKQLKPLMFVRMRLRDRAVRGMFAFLAGVAATLIFPPYAGSWEGYVALIAFLAVLLGEDKDDGGKNDWEIEGQSGEETAGRSGQENGDWGSCCSDSKRGGSFGDEKQNDEKDGGSGDRKNGEEIDGKRGRENNGRSGQENSGRPVWRKWFGAAYVFGFSFYAVSFSWISNALLIDGNKFAAFIPVVFAATGFFFGLFWAVPAALAAGGRNIYARALLFCAWFVFFEWIRSFIFTGFPWNLLGTALAFDARAIQGAAYIGTYGLSLLLLLLLCGVAILIAGAFRRRFYRGAFWFVLLPAGGLLWAAAQYEKTVPGDMMVRLVQPSIPQTFKWEPELAYRNFRKYIDLSKSRPSDGVKLVVWGETASPYFLDRDERHLAEITEAVPDGGFLITGLLRAGVENGTYLPYNSMFVINGRGEIKDYYDKAHLVPFGEYLPFREYLPAFMAPVASVVGDLGSGEKYKNLQVAGLPLMGGAICYESIFPKEVLNPEQKPGLLVVLANDGWYGVSAGPYQHLAAAQMRAVEEGITVIRSANTGISAVIAPNGDMSGLIGLNEEGISDTVLPKVLEKSTLYGRYGNIVPGGLLLFCLLLALLLNSSVINTTRRCSGNERG